MNTDTLISSFNDKIRTAEFPCVGAKSALAVGSLDYFVARRIDQAVDDLPLYTAITGFGRKLDFNTPHVQSFAAIFECPDKMDEKQFEDSLWNRLQALHNIDAARGEPWALNLSQDPDSPHFSLSLEGTGYFVIGLHPFASRSARRFPHPILVFNSHEQFENLRIDGRFDKMKNIIRKRDIALDGSINPMVSDFGDSAETRQYSGRVVDEDWECPFEAQEPLS